MPTTSTSHDLPARGPPGSAGIGVGANPGGLWAPTQCGGRVTRIVGGTARGRRLAVPSGDVTRPTSDRAREAMFSTLHGLHPLSGAHVVDLYAGSGALGLESLSRGAAHALFIEGDRRVAAVLRRNIQSVGLTGAVIVRDQVQRTVAADPRQIGGARPPYDVVFADPPYSLSDLALAGALTELERAGWLAEGALLIVERSARSEPWVWPTPLRAVRDRRYGQAWLWYGRAP